MKRIAVLVAALAAPARAGDFVDVRLSFTATHENVLVKPGETNPSIPGFRIGAPSRRWGTLFFDNYDTRFTGFENLSHLVLYKAHEVGPWDVEGAFVLRVTEISDVATSFADGGSYLKITRWLDETQQSKANVSFTAFPLSADRFRAGYSYKISWGGSPLFFKGNPDNPFASAASNRWPVPGARLQFANEFMYVFAGAKSSVLLNKLSNEEESVYAGLAGAGWDVLPELRIEANGGLFDRGANPKQEVLGERIVLGGVTMQATYHVGMPVGTSVDFKLYQNDPTSLQRFFKKEPYPGGVQWLASSEATFLTQSLQDPDLPQSTVQQPAVAIDLNLRLKWDFLRVSADLLYRDLAYVLHNVPSFVPFQAFSRDPARVVTQPEVFAALSADYHFEALALTVGAAGGWQQPASFTGRVPRELQGNNPETIPQEATVVVRQEGLFSILPPGDAPTSILAGKAWARMDFAEYFQIVFETLFAIDNNETQLVRTDPESGYVRRRFANPFQLGFNLALLARL
jgi:hypothetical protein